jgi:hypothetical protein
MLTEKVKGLVKKIVSQNSSPNPLEHLHNFFKNGKRKKGKGEKEKMEVN